MIPALILLLIRKYRAYLRQKKKIIVTPVKMGGIVSCLIIASFSGHPQEQVRQYSIMYKGDKVGTMKFHQSMKEDTSYFKIVSDVKMRFVFQISVFSMEESYFNNGKMIQSNFFRDVNGTRKMTRQTKAQNNVYRAFSDGKQTGSYQGYIEYNIARLYCMEPVNIGKVYSDAFQQFLPVKKIENHTYRIELPDGNYNYYSYQNGICNRIDVHQSMYSLQIVLN